MALLLKTRRLMTALGFCLTVNHVVAAPPTWLPNDALPMGAVILRVEDLKGFYLECDRLAAKTFLDSSTAASCSLVAEELRRVGFDGRADAVLAWWRTMTHERNLAASQSFFGQRAVASKR
ncbi:MAG: hypothetical protein ACKOF9_08145 [Burkholderiales bacterium]